MTEVCLALAWHPRGEQERFARFYPQIQALYRPVMVTVPPGSDRGALALLRDLPDLCLLEDGEWRSGRHRVIAAALESGADHVHYLDGDRLIRWIETRPDELRATVERLTQTDFLIVGRTEAAFATHPQAQQQPERLSNSVFSALLGKDLDLSSGSKGFSRRAVEFLMRNSPSGDPMGADAEWTVLLWRGGFALEQVLVDGLDWETADRYLPQAADAETQRRAAAEYDADPAHWAFRVQVAQAIIDAGFEALTRPLKET